MGTHFKCTIVDVLRGRAKSVEYIQKAINFEFDRCQQWSVKNSIFIEVNCLLIVFLERIEHMRGLESRINLITDKGCCLYQATRQSKLMESLSHKKRDDMKTASLGRRTRAGQHRDVSTQGDCESRGPLIECIRVLNRLTTELHAEASCIRSEISEIHDSFGEQNSEQNDVKKELFEMSKYVRILEHRLKQVSN